MTVLILSEAERTKRDKVIAQLSADNENVILIAMNVLKRMAAEHRLTVYEYLLNAPAASSAVREIEEARERAQRAEMRAERAEREARQRTPDPLHDVNIPYTWRAELKDALDYHTNRRRFLNAWETSFATDLISRGQQSLSDKQALKVTEVLKRFATLPKAKTTHEDWEDDL